MIVELQPTRQFDAIRRDIAGVFFLDVDALLHFGVVGIKIFDVLVDPTVHLV